MLIDISMAIKRGMFFRHGVKQVEIRHKRFYNNTEGEYETTALLKLNKIK